MLAAGTFAVLALAGVAQVNAQAGFEALPYPFVTAYNHTCFLKAPIISCPSENATSVDSCCVETYGGLVLQTQFWSTWTGREEQGQLLPPQTWSLHGLWPDFCNGSYTGYCDISRQFDPAPSPNVSSNGTSLYAGNDSVILNNLETFGALDLIQYMTKYWINQIGTNLEFWAHEFSKHATCYSTFQTACYGPQYIDGEEQVDFFKTTVEAYKRYPTYEWLAEAGIQPSNTTTFTLSDVVNVLTKRSGAVPYIGCSGDRYNTTSAGWNGNDTGRTVISEVWYYNHAFGRLQDLNLIPVNATSSSGCATSEGALHYYLRGSGTEWTA